MGLGILTDGGHAGTGSGYLSVGSQSVLKMLSFLGGGWGDI